MILKGGSGGGGGWGTTKKVLKINEELHSFGTYNETNYNQMNQAYAQRHLVRDNSIKRRQHCGTTSQCK